MDSYQVATLVILFSCPYINVNECPNTLEDRMSEKDHPEHIRSLTSMPPRYTVHRLTWMY